MTMPSIIHTLIRLFSLMFALIVVSCGSMELQESELETAPIGSVPEIKTGLFLDAAVSGINFEADPFSGITDSAGTFRFLEGDPVKFYIGNIVIGEGPGKSEVTPVDLVENGSSTHPAVINIARFLQTMDADGDPTNGITVSTETAQAIVSNGQSIDFSMDPETFGNNEIVKSIVSVVAATTQNTGGKAELVSASVAMDHLGNTLESVGLVNAGITVTTISGDTTEAGGSATFSVSLKSEPASTVILSVASSDKTEGTVQPETLTFTQVNFNAPQLVTVTGVNDDVKDGNVSYTITIAISSTVDPNYISLIEKKVAVKNIDDETAGFSVSAISQNTTEGKGTATFTVKLNSQPESDVQIGLSSNDSTEGTISPTSLTFTSANWNANQTVTVTGVDDNVQDGSQSYKIIVGAAVSQDVNYSGLNPDDVTVTNTDNDTAGVTVSTISGNTTEASGTATFTVVLNSQPTETVTIPVSSKDTTEGTPSVSSLTFTTTNWNASQTVTVTGVNDNVQDGNQSYTIELDDITSTDTNYNKLNPGDVTVINTDNDTAGLTVSTISGNTTEASGTATFTVKLNSQPTADVVLTIASSNTAEGTVSASTLTFTSSNYNATQTITVTGVDDNIVDGNQSYTISVTVNSGSTSDTSGYKTLSASSVSVTNTDNDTAGLTVSTISANTTEAGGTATFTVRLNSQP
ncbi:MAG: hypothetical protein HQM11_04180, partial [SAR324 cluster bacterium]|nr:hypothetical protein [SAR324 cluster bacterium]